MDFKTSFFKQSYMVLLLLVAWVAVFGCASKTRFPPTPTPQQIASTPLPPPYLSPTPTPTNQVTVNESFNGGQVTLNDEEFLAISLEINPSSGAIWQVAGVESDGPTLHQSSQIIYEQSSELLGAPVRQIIRFDPLQAGSTIVNLAYQRPTENEPEKTYSVEVFGFGEFDKGTALTAPPEESNTPPSGMPDENRSLNTTALGLPNIFNWCDRDGCSTIKTQGLCGSCWAFATVGVIEANIKIKDNIERDLSEQFLISCNEDGYSCGGGLQAFDYFVQPGTVLERDFPYVSLNSPIQPGIRGAPCKPGLSFGETITNWGYVSGRELNQPSVEAIKQAIYTYGPVYASVCVGPAFQAYRSGIFRVDERHYCAPYQSNHAIVLTGWDDAQGIFHLRNSWGEDWGEKGYMRIGYNVSNVGASATYAIYKGISTGKIEPKPQITIIPNAPSNLTATRLEQQVELKWLDRSDNEEGFQIFQWEDESKTWSLIATVEANATSYVATGKCNTKYYYQVQAFNKAGQSQESNLADATTAGCNDLEVPLNLTAKSSKDEINLTWLDTNENEGGFLVARWNGLEWQVDQLEAGITTYIDQEVVPKTNYYYMVSAFIDDNHSNWSNIVKIKLIAPKLNAPQNLQAELTSKNQIALTWVNQDLNVDNFIVERWDNKQWKRIATTKPTMDVYIDEDVVCDNEYYYLIYASNPYNNSNYSNLAKAKTNPC